MGIVLDLMQMDSQSRAFELPLETHGLAAGTPLRCPRPMAAQPLEAWTPVSMLGALVTALARVPRAALMAPLRLAFSRLAFSRRA